MTWHFVLADARRLPLCRDVVDVIIADPPYEGRWRGKRHLPTGRTGYVKFSGRDWWTEAMRVLKPSGHLYVFTIIKELPKWLAETAELPLDILCWHQPNGLSLSAFWRCGIGGRPPCWRPILHWQKAPRRAIDWPGGYVQGNHFEAAQIQSNMNEALPWPNQLPRSVVDWLLGPHQGLVLDLFSGSGTTGEAASRRGQPVISVDMARQALALGRQRPQEVPLPGLMEAGPCMIRKGVGNDVP